MKKNKTEQYLKLKNRSKEFEKKKNDIINKIKLEITIKEKRDFKNKNDVLMFVLKKMNYELFLEISKELNKVEKTKRKAVILRSLKISAYKKWKTNFTIISTLEKILDEIKKNKL